MGGGGGGRYGICLHQVCTSVVKEQMVTLLAANILVTGCVSPCREVVLLWLGICDSV
jgi:hypothetical protein